MAVTEMCIRDREMVLFSEVKEKYDIIQLKDLIQQHVDATGSEKGKRILDNFEEYLPNAEQRKIADFLIALERRIDAQQSLVDNLKKYKRGVVAAIFSHQLKFSDATGNPYPERCV